MPTTPRRTEQPDNTYNCNACEQVYNIDESDSYTNSEGLVFCYDCYYDNYGCCNECGEEHEREYLIWHDGSEEYYCEDCSPTTGDDVDLESYNECSVISLETNSFLVNKFKRAVGVEIETIGDRDRIQDFNAEEYNFRKATDGSISTDGLEGDSGAEFISKPMSGDYLFNQIDSITNFLIENDFYVNKSCGFHVHIDARDLYYKELKAILLVAKQFEKHIYNMMPSSRRGSRWCRKLGMSKDIIKSINSNSDLIETWYESSDTYPELDKYNDSRYHGLNLHARIYLGTIEFRYHSGTNNPIKIKNWITICQSIVAKGIELSKSIEEGSTEYSGQWITDIDEDDISLEDFIEVLGLEEIRGYILRRIHKLNGDNLNVVDDVYIQDYLSAI